MGPTQSGVVDGCRKFYTVQSGDTCWQIANDHEISLAQFYAWNPSGMKAFIIQLQQN
jgi:LysM repeat protein